MEFAILAALVFGAFVGYKVGFARGEKSVPVDRSGEAPSRPRNPREDLR